MGPKALRSGRPRYNTALANTDNSELLLNFVRLKYNELPYFLEVTSISSSSVTDRSRRCERDQGSSTGRRLSQLF